MRASVLNGYIDSLLSSGIVEGWALDREAPLDPLALVLTCGDGEEVASGFANLYRGDLREAGIGIGWHGFRLRTDLSVSRLRRAELLLRTADGTELARRERTPVVDHGERGLASVEAVVAADPTVLQDLEALAGCGPVFDRHIRLRGVAAFVRAAYVYMLGRPCDPTGLELYGRLVEEGALSPYALLRVLSESDEFLGRGRLLSAPVAPGFPFRC